MKLTTKEIEEVIADVVGEEVIPLIHALQSKKNQSEFDLANKLKIPVDVTRNQLYRLYNNNLVSFIRKKDKIKGWYIYYWNANLERIEFLITDIKHKKIEKLKERLQREKNSFFFSCPNQCVRTEFEQATNFEFKCPECGELLNQEDNKTVLEEIEKEIKKTEKSLEAYEKKHNPTPKKSK